MAEIADLLTPLGIAIESAGDLGLPEPVGGLPAGAMLLLALQRRRNSRD